GNLGEMRRSCFLTFRLCPFVTISLCSTSSNTLPPRPCRTARIDSSGGFSMLRRCGTWAGLWILCGAILGASLTMSAAEPSKKPLKPGEFNPANETVDLFDAIKAKQVEVKLIPKDSSNGKILITNKTEQGLNLKLPDAVAAVHVVAQMGGGGMMGGIGGGM